MNAIEDIFSEAILYETRGKDNFIVSGAYWIIPDFGNKLKDIKKNGTIVGTYIYDIIPITSPQWVSSGTTREVMESAFGVFTICDYFLTISSFVKKDLSLLLNVERMPVKPVTAVPLPHILPFRDIVPASKSTAGAEGSISHADYVLCVCTIEGRKNHMLLARIWTTLIRRYGFSNVPRLVLVGKWGWRIEEFREFCESTNYLNGKISPRVNISDDALETLYKECLITIFPSFVEGWGLPVGESLAMGKPCLASNASSIPEVGGDFVDYFNPNDYFEALDVIERAIYTKGYIQQRAKNIADNFKPRTWEDLAKNFMDAIDANVRLIREDSSRTLPLQPRIECGRVYSFADLVANQTTSWSDKQVRFALASGWYPLEHWGVWSSASRAEISFFTDATPGEKLIVLLRISLPTPYRGEVLSVRRNGVAIADLGIFNPDHTARWMQIEVVADPDGLVALELCRPSGYALQEGVRDLHVGLSGLAVYPKHDSAAELKVMKCLLTTVGVTLN